MIDLLSIPLYYISFNKSKKLESYYKDNGFKNVNHFQAVDGRKLNVLDLRLNNIISIRAYDDLTNERYTTYGFPTLGAIGCTLSHYHLWKLCVDQQLPYIIIVEDDNVFVNNFKTIDHEKISNAISKDAGLFISTDISYKHNRIEFIYTNFYIASKKACRELIKRCFPMDVQTDRYMAHLATIGVINVTGHKISYQSGRNTLIQINSGLENVYREYVIYISVSLLIVIAILVIVIIFARKSKE